MKNYSSVYRAYDLRSIHNDPMDTTFAYSLGKGMGTHVVKEYGADSDFLVGCDVRDANHELVVAFISGLEDAGCKSWTTCNTAVDSLGEQEHLLGVCSTAFFYRCMYKSFHLGAVFTASHNPPERVGMKNANSSASLLPSHELKEMVEEYEIYPYEGSDEHRTRILSTIQDLLINPDKRITQKRKSYVKVLAEVFDTIENEYTVVVDYSGGACVGYEYAFLQLLEQNSSINLIHLNEKADGTFSAHLSDTSLVSTYEQVGEWVREHNADFGILFDGDGDRIGFVDESGTFIGSDRLIAVIAGSMLEENPGGAVIHDITCTNSAREGIKKYGGIPYASRVGYRFIKTMMKEKNAIFGGELSGHMLFPETGYAESPLLAFAHVIRALQGFESFSAMIDGHTSWLKEPMINYTVDDKDSILETIKEEFKEFDQDFTDGIRVDGLTWWFCLRPSNTEPILRLFIEGKIQKDIDDIKEKLLPFIK